MLIILEGCDGSGKSTLAQKLAKLLNAEVIHCSSTSPNDFAFFSNIVEASDHKNIIADRFCYGQFVYQEEFNRPLRNKGDGDSIQVLGQLEATMLQHDVKVVLVTAPDEVIKDRLAGRKETIIEGLSVEQVQNRFKAIRSMSVMPWLTYDSEEGTLS